MTNGQKSPPSGWAKGVLLASQVTVVVGSLVAVGLLIRLQSDTALTTASGVALASGGPQITNGVADKPVVREQPSGSDPKRPAALLGGAPTAAPPQAPTAFGGTVQMPGSASIISNGIRPGGSDLLVTPRAGRPDIEAAREAAAAAALEAPRVVGPREAQPTEARATRSDEPPAIDPQIKADGADVNTKADATASIEPAAPTVAAAKTSGRPSSPTTRVEPREPSTNRPDRTAAIGPKQQDTDAQGTRARAPQPSRPQAAKADGQTEPKRQPPAAAQRSRTALAQTDGAPAPSAAAQPSPPAERSRFLGIPLPSGSEVRQCLLEFRC